MAEACRHIHLGFTQERYPEGTHICYLYNSDEERRRILPLFARQALLENEAFGYLADVPARAQLADAIAQLDMGELLMGAPGQVELATSMEGYYPDGSFDPELMLAKLHAKYVEARAAGLAGARVAGEMDWALRGVPGTERIVECESRINQLAKDAPITVMCQYDLRKFDGAMMFDVMNVHPVIIVGGHILRNPFYQHLPAMEIRTGAADGGPSAAVLGRLLVIQQAIDAIPDEIRMAAFVRRALSRVPGIADVFLHIEGVNAPPPQLAALLGHCATGSVQESTHNRQRELGAGIQCFPMDAPGQHLGSLVVQVADGQALRPYLPFLSNISSAINRVLASRRYQARLTQLNEELRDARDSLEMRVAERTRELEYRATHDPVTGLANRALLIDRLHGAIMNAQRDGHMVAVVYLDLDSFSFMNTGLGNACGDAFLCETARRLRRLVRESDTVARIGSDEFVILLAGLENIERSSARLSAMLAAVREPVPLAGKDVVVTASIGACVYPLDGSEAELLLRRANTAMHRAKASGKDNVKFYARTRDAPVAERMELETELRQAIPAGELTIHYQPKLDVASNRYVGAEALVRWEHPRRGLLPPGRFIPIAEDSALIVALGEHVLRRACLQARLWQEAGLEGMSVAVNVAARQLRDDRIVETVGQVLRETGLAPASLELEITESSIMHDLEHASALLHKLKDLGVTISIDDFGTGYSSLSALRNFPADKLKIDRSFVHEIETAPSAAAVALAVISFARTLGMRVNAEGVETLGQARCLKQHGCDELQGFLLARPAPPDHVQALFRQPGLAGWDSPGA